jgi:branched-chain amino acid transport system substrate-binding protein
MGFKGIRLALTGAALASAAWAMPAQAEVTVGVVLGATGPAASISIPYANVYQMVPRTVGGQSARFIILDDTGNPSEAVKHARRLVSEDKVDVILGSTYTPACLAMADVALESRTPMICMSPTVVSAEKHPWFFTIPQRLPVMIGGIVGHMQSSGVKTVGFIGFTDGWGDLTLAALEQTAGPAGIKVVARERYQRNETSVTAQVLKVMAANPDAVFLGASGTPAALPQVTLVERGYKGRIYQTHGAINKDFLRVGGKNVEGAIAPTGPLVVADQLPDSNPIKRVSLQFFKMYDAAYPGDARNPFAGYGYDGYLFLSAGVVNAAKTAKPGTPEFRAALREGMENLKEVVGTHAVYNTSTSDHNGADERARVMVTVQGGSWKLLQ